MPEREDDHLTPATRLLEKRREMAEVEQALAAQKEVYPVMVLQNIVKLPVTANAWGYYMSRGMSWENYLSHLVDS